MITACEARKIAIKKQLDLEKQEQINTNIEKIESIIQEISSKGGFEVKLITENEKFCPEEIAEILRCNGYNIELINLKDSNSIIKTIIHVKWS